MSAKHRNTTAEVYKLRFLSCDQFSKQEVASAGYKTIIDLSLKGSKSWKDVLNYLKNKWSSLTSISQRIELFFSDSLARPAENIIKQCSSMTVADSIAKYCAYNVSVSTNGVREVRLFYRIKTSQNNISTNNNPASNNNILSENYLHLSSNLTPLPSLRPVLPPPPSSYLEPSRSAVSNSIGDDTMMVFLSSMCDSATNNGATNPCATSATEFVPFSSANMSVSDSAAAMSKTEEVSEDWTLSSIWNLFNTSVNPTTSAINPTTSAINPTTSAINPTTSAINPTTSAINPTTSAINPTTSAINPTTSAINPTTSDINPTTSAINPTTSDINPTTGDINPTTSDINPTVIVDINCDEVSADTSINNEAQQFISESEHNNERKRLKTDSFRDQYEYSSHSNSTLDTVSSSTSSKPPVLTIQQLMKPNSKPHLKRITPTYIQPLLHGKRRRSIGE